jgi:glycerol kinase
MNSGVFVGIDHGGSTTTSLVFDPDRGKLSSHSVSMPKSTPGIGLVEHRPDDFIDTSMASANGALAQAGLSWADVCGIGIANQGETSIAWSSETGLPLGPALSWEDKRTQGICDALARDGVGALVKERTGVVLNPYFSAAKFKWLKENIAKAANAAKSGTLRMGGTDSFLIHHLTGGEVHVTEPGTASRTALFNLHNLEWDRDLVDAFGLTIAELPQVIPSCGDFGLADHESFGGARVAITANVVDAHAALFAQGCTDNSTLKATYGTGAFIEVNTGRDLVPPDGIIPAFVAWTIAGQTDFTLEGGVFSVGSAIDWAVRVGLLPSAAESANFAFSVPDSGGVSMVPCLSGLSAPHWLPLARGGLNGLGLDTRPGHIARALLDGIAFQCADVIRALDAKTGGSVREIRADGGPSRNPYLMQRQADLLNMPISVSLEPDMTGLGAACLAAIGAGQMTPDDVRSLGIAHKIHEPAMGGDERESLWSEWNFQVQATIDQTTRYNQ